jgi:hypothetical protein
MRAAKDRPRLILQLGTYKKDWLQRADRISESTVGHEAFVLLTRGSLATDVYRIPAHSYLTSVTESARPPSGRLLHS